MAFKVYLDEDSAHGRIVTEMASAGIDVLSTVLARNTGLSDEAQLAYATRAGRAILTANRKDFFRIHRDWMVAGKTHAGMLVLSRQDIPVSVVVRQVLRLQHYEPDQMTNAILFITANP